MYVPHAAKGRMARPAPYLDWEPGHAACCGQRGQGEGEGGEGRRRVSCSRGWGWGWWQRMHACILSAWCSNHEPHVPPCCIRTHVPHVPLHPTANKTSQSKCTRTAAHTTWHLQPLDPCTLHAAACGGASAFVLTTFNFSEDCPSIDSESPSPRWLCWLRAGVCRSTAPQCITCLHVRVQPCTQRPHHRTLPPPHTHTHTHARVRACTHLQRPGVRSFRPSSQPAVTGLLTPAAQGPARRAQT